MAFKSIRGRRGKRRIHQHFELQLTSMMDILVIIVVFLLKSYQASTNSFTSVQGLKLPISVSKDMPPDSLHLIITPEAITFEGERILEFTQVAADAGAGAMDAAYKFKKTDLDERSLRIIPVFDALTKAKEKAELLRAKAPARDAEGKPLPFEGILAIQADKRVKYDTLRKVMYSAGAAGYQVVRLLAQQKEQ